MKKVAVDRKKCIGCGTCILIAPNTFKLGEDGKSKVLKNSKDSEKDIKEAIESCPVEAISRK